MARTGKIAELVAQLRRGGQVQSEAINNAQKAGRKLQSQYAVPAAKKGSSQYPQPKGGPKRLS